MKIKYVEKGTPFDFKRIDRERTIHATSAWESGGLLYCKLDRFNIAVISKEDIIEIEN